MTDATTSVPGFSVISSQFADGAPIPPSAAYTAAGGENISPDLSWSGAPPATRSFALTCYDPDAPTDIGFVHWVMFDIPAATTALPAGAGSPGRLPEGAGLGFTDWGGIGWGGMAPPPGDDAHHYRFTVYALDIESSGCDAATTYAKFRFMTRAHVLATATVTGRFGLLHGA